MNHNLGRNNAAAVDQFLSRNSVQCLTKHQRVVHATTHRILGLARSCSEEVAVVCHLRNHGSFRKELLAGSIMCLIEVSYIDVNTSINNLVQRVIGGEDQAGLTSSTSGVVEQSNFILFGGAEVMSVATMNVHDVNVLGINHLQVFFTQLVDQQQPRNNTNRRQTTLRGAQTALEIHDSNQCLAATSGHQHGAVRGGQHGIESGLLVGAKFHVSCVCMNVLLHEKRRVSTRLALVLLIKSILIDRNQIS